MSDATMSVLTRGGEAAAPESAPVLRGRSAAALILAVDLGILGDVMLRAPSLGINFTIWWWGVIAAAIWLTRSAGIPLTRRRAAIFAAAAAFALFPAIRQAEEITLFTCVAVGTLLVLAAWTGGAPDVSLARSPLAAYVRTGVTTVLHGLRGPFPLLSAEAKGLEAVRERHANRWSAIIRGLALATPIVLVFTLLLASADPSFEGLVDAAFSWDADVVVSHAVLFAVFAWFGASYLCGSLSRWDAVAPPASKPLLGIIEAGVVLGAIDGLFLIFMLAQLRYLFGGAEHVLSTAGLTYAEYARRGFFELTAVTALSMPLLVAIFAAVQPQSAMQARARRLLSMGLIVLLLGIVGSALWRMHLYEQMFGWTLDRLYATAIMLWIAGTLVWFARTTLRDRGERFVFGPIVGGLGLIAAFGIANPTGVVLSVNARRAAAGADFDGLHAASLGIDGIPTLVRVLPSIAPSLDLGERCAIARSIDRARDPQHPRGGWRGANLSYARARAAIGDNWASIDRSLAGGPCPADGRAGATSGGEQPGTTDSVSATAR
jgi:hypothetical protein